MTAKEELSAIRRLVHGCWDEPVQFNPREDGWTLNRVKELMHYSQKYAHLAHCEDCDAAKAAAAATTQLSKCACFGPELGS